MSNLTEALALLDEPDEYSVHISLLTIDKLGVKLYDRASAVVAELIANCYDADAEHVRVTLPMGVQLAAKDKTTGEITDHGYEIVVSDDGHGMTPAEAQAYFLSVGSDRRTRPSVLGSGRSRHKRRRVMGRKGIGKLAPFGICRSIEVRSAGGEATDEGYRVSHFILDYETIVNDDADAAGVTPGADDRTWDASTGTTVTLSGFLPKRVPSQEIFDRQIARRFALAAEDFEIAVADSETDVEFAVARFQVPIDEKTRIDLSTRPVPFGDENLAVKGWMAFGKQAFKNEEEAGVRIYARGKLVATTRDFEQPAGFTGEFTARSYLVGEVQAEWLDEEGDDSEDLIRTDRQGILWDSEYGEALRTWGSQLIKEIAKASAGPRRESKTALFLEVSQLEERAQTMYSSNKAVVEAIMDFGKKVGGLSHEDELADEDYVEELVGIILQVGPHQALINSFRTIAGRPDRTIEELLPLFEHTRTAELASYAQLAAEHVAAIKELEVTIHQPGVVEGDLQKLIARAPWLIAADWSAITKNQALKTFRDQFQIFWKERYKTEINIAISYEKKQPDFTLIQLGSKLHIVEIKKPGHDFANNDYDRLQNYLYAFEEFFEKHPLIAKAFPEGWGIELIADGLNVTDPTKKRALKAELDKGTVIVLGWVDFLLRTKTAHESFLAAEEKAREEELAADEDGAAGG